MKRANPGNRLLHRSTILAPSHWLPHLHIDIHFVQPVIRLVRENPFNRKLVPKVPQSAKKRHTSDPEHASCLAHLVLQKAEDIRKTRWVPRVAEQFPNCAPHEFSQRAEEENVVIILRLPTQGARARRGTPTPPNVIIRWEALPGKLPKEDPHLHGDPNPPQVAEIFARGALAKLKVQRSDREPPRRFKSPSHGVLMWG
jgi:hypothetical protein